MGSALRMYRVVLAGGVETILMLSPETAARDYPTAREVKVPSDVFTKTPSAADSPGGSAPEAADSPVVSKK